MIPLNFYRDDEYVYYNNPNGITKKMTIAVFESMMSGESVLPEYSSSSQGKVLSVDSDGDLDWASLPPAELPAYTSSDGGKVLTVNSGGTGVEWGAGGASSPLICNVGTSGTAIVLDKTFAEIKTAILAGLNTYILAEMDGESSYNLIYGYTEDATRGHYYLYCSSSNFSTWSCSSSSDYPTHTLQ